MNLDLDLIKLRCKKTNAIYYYAVNDSHYNGLPGSVLSDDFSWEYLGTVHVPQKVLNEEREGEKNA